MTQFAKNYVVISPVRDEEAYLRFTIESMLAQTVRPIEWIIVNDGSTDNTAAIIDEYASQHCWIRAVHRLNRGFRKAGGGVVEAFNDGYHALSTDNWQFIVKLDGDLTFEPDYFEKCLTTFSVTHTSASAAASFAISKMAQNGSSFVPSSMFVVPRKSIAAPAGRRSADFGRLLDGTQWTKLKQTCCIGAQEAFRVYICGIIAITGTADGIWAGMVKNGRANYVCGYHPLFMLVKCFLRLPKRPYFIGSVGLLYGFLTGYVKQIPQVNDIQTIGFLRRQQLGRLWGRETIWR